jgi:hypothetical protein
MTIERKTIIGAADRARRAVVTFPVAAGGEVDIDPSWEFLGFEDEQTTASEWRAVRDFTERPLDVEP